jgi:hypothetical protein
MRFSCFSVTDYSKYYAYFNMLLSFNTLSLQQLWYYFPNRVYPNLDLLQVDLVLNASSDQRCWLSESLID